MRSLLRRWWKRRKRLCLDFCGFFGSCLVLMMDGSIKKENKEKETQFIKHSVARWTPNSYYTHKERNQTPPDARYPLSIPQKGKKIDIYMYHQDLVRVPAPSIISKTPKMHTHTNRTCQHYAQHPSTGPQHPAQQPHNQRRSQSQSHSERSGVQRG